MDINYVKHFDSFYAPIVAVSKYTVVVKHFYGINFDNYVPKSINRHNDSHKDVTYTNFTLSLIYFARIITNPV